jgi:hypothetical protein
MSPQSIPPANAGRSDVPTPIAGGERELLSGMLSKTASFRLIVTGKVAVKEIERLIKKLELDKEILADEDAEDPRDPDLMLDSWREDQSSRESEQ